MAQTQTDADPLAHLRPKYTHDDEALANLSGHDEFVFEKALETAIREQADRIQHRRSLGIDDAVTDSVAADRQRHFAKLLLRFREANDW